MALTSPAAGLAAAIKHLRDGDADAALAALGAVLAVSPDHVDALGLLAAVRESRGDRAGALAALDRAVAAAPGNAQVLAARARVSAAVGRIEAALADLERSVQLDPELVDAWHLRGRILERLGRFADALGCHQAVLRSRPGEPAAIAGAAFCLAGLGRHPEALAAYDAVLRLLPDHLDLQANRARCLQKLQRHDEALAACDRYLGARPDDREVQIQRAGALFGLDRLEEALAVLDRADPLGVGVEANANRGLVLLGLGFPDRAWDALNRAVEGGGEETDEHGASLRYHRGLCALYTHALARAWPDYEHRWRAGLVDPPALDRGEPAWDGGRVEGALRVWREQPVGDEVLFSRLLPLARARAARLVLECSPRMVPLFARSFPELDVRPQGEAGGGADAQVSLASLGAVLRVDTGDLDDGAPYLRADRAKTAALRDRYERLARGRPIVGISWSSNNQRIGAGKSAPLLEWGALLSQDRLFVNLQYGTAANEADAARSAFGCEIVTDPAVDQLADLDAFAAQVRAMDHVVSVSNTTVHFAGALGVPCSVLVAPGRARLWYWGCEGEVTPWYRSVRLRRRARGTDWAAQVAAVAAELAAEFDG